MASKLSDISMQHIPNGSASIGYIMHDLEFYGEQTIHYSNSMYSMYSVTKPFGLSHRISNSAIIHFVLQLIS